MTISRSFFPVREIQKQKHRSGYTTKFAYRRRQRPASRSSNVPLQLDAVATQLIKLDFEKLKQRKHSATVFEFSNVLMVNRSLKDHFSTKQVPRVRQREWDRRRRNQEEVKRRYAFVNAVNSLKSGPDTAKVLETWEEFKEIVSSFFSFPPEVDTEAQLEEIEAESRVPTAFDATPAVAELSRRMFLLRTEKPAKARPSSILWASMFNRSSSRPTTLVSAEITNTAEHHMDKADILLSQRLEEEYNLEKKRYKDPALEQFEKEEREREAKQMAESILRPLTDEENELVQKAWYDGGALDDVIAEEGADTIIRSSIHSLRQHGWLTDEVIHYFLLMLTKRDEAMCASDGTRKRSHFFKSFFITKLLNEGHANPAMDGKYEYKNVKRWSKKVPGKDIFNLSKIIFPINQSGSHWVCAVAFMEEKKIQFYDSMGSGGQHYLEHIFKYIQDEHQAKKSAPLPDLDSWTLVQCTDDTPQQFNGYDCGVFTCMFADFVSKDCPLLFNQSHVTMCRERITLSIMNGKAIL